MTMIGGRLGLELVMDALAKERPVFHSEADFQFAFAQTVAELSKRAIECRLEVPSPALDGAARRNRYLDLRCRSSSGTSHIEFKYATRPWQGRDAHGEDFAVRNHAAYDLTRRYFIHDIERLEEFVSSPRDNGVAILLTNEPSLWKPATSTKQTRFENFRLHDGRSLSGLLRWGFDDAPTYDVPLRGTYELGWRDYSTLDGSTPTAFRWLAVEIAPRARA